MSRWWVVFAALAVVAAGTAARAEVWIRIEGLAGAPIGAGPAYGAGGYGPRAGWIEARAMVIGGGPEGGTAASGMGARMGGPRELRLMRAYDRASPALAEAAATGRRFQAIEVQETDNTGRGIARDLVLRDAMIIAYSVANAAQGPVGMGRDQGQETVTIAFAQIEAVNNGPRRPGVGSGRTASDAWQQPRP